MPRRLAEYLFLIVAIAVFSWVGRSPYGENSRLDLDGSSGDWVTEGKVWRFTSPGATFQGSYTYHKPERGVTIHVEGFDGPLHGEYSLNFAAPCFQRLSVGHYDEAIRLCAAEGEYAGLDVYGNGRGSNQLTGSFDVLEVEYGENGPVRFAADFVQYSEGKLAHPLRGSIRFHSTLP